MIIHVDMDAYYASVEQRDNPSLVGKPVVVGGSPDGRGVVSAASYEARRFGIHSAMSMRSAVRLCPNLIIVRTRMDHYAKISKSIRSIFEAYTPLVEPLSLDEAFLDVTATSHLFGDACTVGQLIKSRIQEELGLIASVGIAPNKFVAKIASDLHKPDALVVVQADEVERFLGPLPIEKIWGVGKVTAKAFHKIGLHTISELRRLGMEELRSVFGNSAEHYWELARGIDQRPVVPERDAKTISSETTFFEDIQDRTLLEGWLGVLVESVSRRVRYQQVLGKGVEIKVRYHDFRTITRSMALSKSTDSTDDLLTAAQKLFQRIPVDGPPIRLLGFGVHSLCEPPYQQLSLFDQPEADRRRKLDSIADTIADRFGKGAMHRGISQPRKRNR